MARRILIPGTGGCLYRTSDGDEYASLVQLLFEGGGLLECRHAPAPSAIEPLATSQKPDGTNPGSVLEVTAHGYHRAVYYPFESAHPEFDVFFYDWRLDIRRSGALLLDWLRLSYQRHGEKHDVVCHSQGGLVLLWAARLAHDQDEPYAIRKLIRRVVFVGVPLLGTLNAADGLLSGAGLFGLVNIDASVVRTWPSIYMMLPWWEMGLVPGDEPDLLREAPWRAAGLLPGNGESLDLDVHIDPRLLLRARYWFSAFRYGVDLFEPLRRIEHFKILMGNNIPTRLRVPNFPHLPAVERIDGRDVVRGDSLVPADFTHHELPGWVQADADIVKLPAADHMMLCADPNLYQQCKNSFDA